MIQRALGPVHIWSYDEGRDLGQGHTRCQSSRSANACAGQRLAEENQEGLRP